MAPPVRLSSALLSTALATLAVPAAAAPPQPNILPFPPSTLLAPGTTSLPLNLTTSQPATCRWGPSDVPFSSLPNTFEGGGTTSQTTTLVGLSGNVTVTPVYIQCDVFASSDPPLVLSFRSLPDSGNAPFPRLGNLWGSDNFRGHPEGLQYPASRSSLWLGADWSATEIATLRSFNPHTIALTSINACETNEQDLPDSYYLTNITQPPSTKGRLQSWPGAWRLDLTNPAVQEYQATLMYCLTVFGGTGYGPDAGCSNVTVPPMVFDGLFVDNVFMDDGAAVNSRDIFGNPFVPINQTTGQPMADFNEQWKLGMIAMLVRFRAKMPYAILDGHAMDITDGNISDSFNAISLGFIAPQTVEGLTSFSDSMGLYTSWMSLPSHMPRITMVESAVRLKLGYGYGFDQDLITLISSNCTNSHSVPGAPMPGIGNACDPTTPSSQRPGYMLPQTFLFARSEYRYMRFGLTFTLMSDGYFAHEVGDSWHGQDWDYDELHFSLGLALGNATPAHVLDPTPPPPIPPPIPLTTDWSLWVRDPNTSNASWSFDAGVVPFAGAPASVRVDVNNTASSIDGIDLSQIITDFQDGGYLLSFYARSSRDATPVHLNSRKNGGDWHSFGLDAQISVSSGWQQFNISFVAATDGTPARLSWWLGFADPDTSVWVNSPTLVGIAEQLPVLIREFECGFAVVNGDTRTHTVILPDSGSVARLSGQQAPLYQYIVDDNMSAPAFQILSGNWTVGDFDNGYDGVNAPTQEEVRPSNGYFHHWMVGAHQSLSPVEEGEAAVASFNLSVPVAGTYDVSMWWPAAVPARSGWSKAMGISITSSSSSSPSSGGSLAAQREMQVTVDLTQEGGDVFYPVALGVELDPTSTLTVTCPAGQGACIADAVLIESAARWNDGSPAPNVTLQGMDGIVLQKVGASSCGGSSGGKSGAVQ